MSGALDAMGSGALAGAIVGALGGAAGGSSAESGEAGAGEAPAVGESSDGAAGEATPAGSVESAPAEAAPAAEPEAAPEESPEEEQACPVGPHSFVGTTPVLMADGSTKPISQVKVGDQISDAVPGDSVQQTHTVQNVITTTTDRDFVDVTVKPSKLGKTLAGVALAAAATLTTTFHHPFYDITQSAFVEAVDLKAGDQVQTADGGTATVTDVHAYHQQATTYDLTINDLHTYYVLAGDTPVLVHNNDGGQCPVSAPRDISWPKFRNTKTAATPDDWQTYTLSGWSSRISRAFTRVSTTVTAALRNSFGMPAKGSGLDLGTPGWYYDSHAERQAYALNGSDSITVTRDPCGECQQFFSYASVSEQATLRISGPSGLYTFHPTGDMEFVPHIPYSLEPSG